MLMGAALTMMLERLIRWLRYNKEEVNYLGLTANYS